MRQDIFWNRWLYKEAVRLAEKDRDEEVDLSDKKDRAKIEMLMEDLNDKYRYE